MGLHAKHVYEFGPFHLDAAKRLLLRNSKPLPLAPKVIETLLVLVENHGQLVEKDELMKAVWPDTFVEEANLAVNISLLRKTLGGEEHGQHYIETVPKRGYRFVSAVREHAAADGTAVAAPGWEEPAHRERSWTALLGLALLAVVALGALLLGLGVLRKRTQPSVAGSSQPIHSVAVLPLQNLSGDPGEEYFADGLTEALVNNLAQVRALRVISRTSVMRYKGTQKPLPEIARELHVDAIVEGSVVRSGGRVRITAQLIEAPTDTHLWARTYESDAGDLLAVQSRLAQAIVEQVRVTLTPEEKVRLATVHAVSPEAQEAYLKGRYFWNQRTPEAMTKSVAYFEEAVQKEPHYALAYAGMAEVYAVMASDDIGAPHEMVPKAKQAAQKALALDDRLGEAYAALAQLVSFYDRDFRAGAQQFRHALDLNPNYASAHQWFGLLLMYQGRFEEASAEINHARELDPLSRVIQADVGLVHLYSGRYDEAIRQGQSILKFEPNSALAHNLLGVAYQQKRLYPQAIAEFEKYLTLSDGDADALMRLGYTYAVSGDLTKARGALRELRSLPRGRYASPCYLAALEGALGNKEQAFRLLDRAFDERAGALMVLAVDPMYDPLRADPRFPDLLRRAGLQP